MYKNGIRNDRLNALFGTLLKEKRLNAGLTQTEAAKFLGLSQETISLIENGKVKIALTDFVRFTKRYAPDIKIEVPRKYKKLYIMLTFPLRQANCFIKNCTINEIQTQHFATPLFIPSNNP